MNTSPTNTRSYADAIAAGEPILTDGPIGTRLRFGTPWAPDPDVRAASYAADEQQARALRAVYVNYATIAREFGLPVVLHAPTSRATPDRARRSAVPTEVAMDLPQRCVRVATEARDRVAGGEVFVAAGIGPHGDAYTGRWSGSIEEAAEHHRPYASALAATGPDLLTASPFPDATEAAGAAVALAETDLDYVVSLVVGEDGALPDGAPLHEAIAAIDGASGRPPVHYTLQCVHPRRAGRALDVLASTAPGLVDRVRGIAGNAADASPADLDGSATVVADDPEPWASVLHDVAERHGTTVLGGCCGTDERHMFSLALRLAG